MPGRMGIHSSANPAAVSLYRGSMTMMRTLLFCLAMTRSRMVPPPLILVSAGSLPKKTTSLLLTMSLK